MRRCENVAELFNGPTEEPPCTSHILCFPSTSHFETNKQTKKERIILFVCDFGLQQSRLQAILQFLFPRGGSAPDSAHHDDGGRVVQQTSGSSSQHAHHHACRSRRPSCSIPHKALRFMFAMQRRAEYKRPHVLGTSGCFSPLVLNGPQRSALLFLLIGDSDDSHLPPNKNIQKPFVEF